MKSGNNLLCLPLRCAALAGVLTLFLSLGSAKAATSYYFDVNGTTSGYGIVAGGTYSWDGNNWATASGGTSATGPWGAGGFARFYSTAGSYTVTVNASESMAGMYMNGGTANTLTINDAGNGTGNLSITSTGSTAIPGVTGGNVQGFLCNGNIVLNCPVIGPGGIQHSQTKDLYLNATNSYAGGTWTTGGQFIYYNNSYAFGSGVIYVGGSGDALINSTANALTITNRFIFPTAGYNLNLAGGNAVAGQPGTTFSGTFSLPSGTTTLYTSSGAAQVDKISGVISGSGAALTISDNGTMILAATNTYTGLTTAGNGPLTGVTPTLEIAGKIAGDVLVTNAAKLVLDHAATLASTARFNFASSLAAGAINLNFTGSNTVQAIYKDGVLQPGGSWGALSSGANHEDAAFTGTGFLYVPPVLVIVQQPASATIFPQKASQTFTVGVTGGDPITYQWKLNNVNLSDSGNVSGSQSSTLTLFPPYNPGNYTCAITNPVGSTNSSAATLTILATNDYVNAVLSANPIAYWRLDETNASANGVIAHDYVGGHNGVYSNVTLNLPGFSAVSGSDPAMWAPRTALSGNNNKGIMIISNAAPDFAFGGFPFTLEAWGMSTNFGAGVKQRLLSTMSLSGSGGYGFGFPNSTTLEFTSGGIADYDITLSTALAEGIWYHFVAAYDGNSMNFFLDGTLVGSVAIPTTIPAPANQLTLGNNPLTFPTEQLQGAIDEVAIYNYALDGGTIYNHYQARYSDLSAPTTTTPVVTPATNYVSLSTTITEAAGGVGLTYQWYKGSGTGNPVPGGTDATLVLSNLQLTDAGSYHCFVTDAASHTADSASASVTVLPIPTSADQLNLTNGLVLHLPFDANYSDISGRQNDGAAVGAPAFVGSGVVGADSIHYGTTNGLATNYVTLGVKPDLQFGATNDFTVAYWVRGNNSSLPYFCNLTNGLSGVTNGGYYFGPSTNGNGSWEVALGGATHQGFAIGSKPLNDGNWHHVVQTIKRSGSLMTYIDGVPESPYAVSFITESLDNGRPTNIGQDGTGGLVLADNEGDLDDLAVWRRTLSQLEVSGVYLAGATNHVSFAPPVSNPPPQVTIQIQQVGNQYQLVWTGGGTLQASPVVNGTYTNVPSASSPYTLPISSGPQLFYRVEF